jgi:ATP-dependent DNA ligase
VARETGRGLDYAGAAMLTLPAVERERFWRQAEALASERPALLLPRPSPVAWLKRELRVEVRFLKGSDKLRHATVGQLS